MYVPLMKIVGTRSLDLVFFQAFCSDKMADTAAAGISIPILIRQIAFHMGPRFCTLQLWGRL